ncbi:MAG: AAA family ATPase [Saprospiraceae bacterium]
MKYPIGIQDFREIRTGGYVYVDKTPHIHSRVGQWEVFFPLPPTPVWQVAAAGYDE